jgi:type IV pilus assembly protein PilX
MMINNYMAYKSTLKQRGLVLPMVLIFLVVMMLLGTAAIRNVTLEEKMAGNFRNRNLAFQAAEQALRYCENGIQTQAIPIPVNVQGPIAGKNYWEVAANWEDPSKSVDVPRSENEDVAKAAELADRPKCLVELIETPVILSTTETAATSVETGNTKTQYRITSRGVGLDANTVVQLQSYLITR